ncbi:Protein-tyrosine sulfotransferase [Nymphaea thermarum]|nr:Protein-tyrosine sulfotransferase [Nymphaea thermarum]
MASASPPVVDGFERCENIVQSWADSSNALKDEIEAKQLKSLQDALFFLHVPRTGGLAFLTWQVAGLTENSCLQESHAIRRCIRMHPSLGNYVLDVAKKRLDKMFFVGLTEKHRESMEMFAHMIEAEVQSLSPASQVNDATGNDTEINSPPTDVEIEKLILQKMTAEYLMEAYDACSLRSRELWTFEYTHSLKEVYPIKFSKKARKQIQNSVIQQILLFNNLDIDLHKHAEAIFKRQQECFKQRHSKVVCILWPCHLQNQEIYYV